MTPGFILNFAQKDVVKGLIFKKSYILCYAYGAIYIKYKNLG